MTADHGTITTPDGTELYTRHWATENATATILLLHGGGEHSGRYGHVAEFFNGRGFELRAYDQRGSGNSGGAEMDIEQWSDFVDDLQFVVESEVLGTKRPWVLYGHSIGGLVSIAYLKDAGRPSPTQPCCRPHLSTTTLRCGSVSPPKVWAASCRRCESLPG